MKKMIIALAVSMSLVAAPVSAGNHSDQVFSFIIGAIIGNAIGQNNNRRNKNTTRPVVRHAPHPDRIKTITYCIEKTWVPAQSIWVPQYYEGAYLVAGHYKTRNGYYENQRYQC